MLKPKTKNMIRFAIGKDMSIAVHQKLKPHFFPIFPQQMKLITVKMTETSTMKNHKAHITIRNSPPFWDIKLPLFFSRFVKLLTVKVPRRV